MSMPGALPAELEGKIANVARRHEKWFGDMLDRVSRSGQITLFCAPY
jgi:hypothetical protein